MIIIPFLCNYDSLWKLSTLSHISSKVHRKKFFNSLVFWCAVVEMTFIASSSLMKTLKFLFCGQNGLQILFGWLGELSDWVIKSHFGKWHDGGLQEFDEVFKSLQPNPWVKFWEYAKFFPWQNKDWANPLFQSVDNSKFILLIMGTYGKLFLCFIESAGHWYGRGL
jgi:hypothetical protein